MNGKGLESCIRKMQVWDSTYPHCEGVACPHATKILIILLQFICSDTSASTSCPLLFFLGFANILGFFIKHLNLRLISALLIFWHFFFNFLFFFCYSPRCSIVLSWIILSNLFCSFNASFSFLICLFKTSKSNTSCFNDWTRVSCAV